MKKYSLHVLLAVNALLVLWLAYSWVDTSGSLRNVHWRAPDPQTTDYAGMAPALPGLAQADTSQFIAMLDRPLFSLTRRPPPPPPSSAEKEPVDNLSSAQLSAIFQGANEGGVIIQIAGKHRRVRLKDEVDGWKLSAVQDRSATFTRAGATRVLQLPRAAVTTANTSVPPLQAGAPPAAGNPVNPVFTPPPPRQTARPSFGGGQR